MKKLLAIVLTLAMAMAFVAACDSDTPASDGGDTPAASDGPMYISVISKGFQHQFLQAVKAGSDQAGIDLGVEVYFDGPEGESAIADQVNMLNAELAKNPAALALAALDTSAVSTQLQDAFNRGIPVIGFDSGVPDAPAGQVAANASTNNQVAAALGATHMFPEIQAAVSAATADSPVVIAVLSQDVTSESITGRTRGFAEEMAKLAGGVNGSVAITGGFAAINTGDANAAVRIEVVVGATPDIVDMTNAANAVLASNPAGVFCSNEGAVSGLLAAINAGTQVPAGTVLVGFDAGEAQKNAVRTGLFFGSVTQDPFQIGYQAVKLAVDAAKGTAVSDVDTGAQWWDSSNMDTASIALLLYD